MFVRNENSLRVRLGLGQWIAIVALAAVAATSASLVTWRALGRPVGWEVDVGRVIEAHETATRDAADRSFADMRSALTDLHTQLGQVASTQADLRTKVAEQVALVDVGRALKQAALQRREINARLGVLLRHPWCAQRVTP